MSTSLLRVIVLACVLGSAVRIGVGGFTLGLHLLLIFAAWAALAMRAGPGAGRVAAVPALWCGALLVHFTVSLVLSRCTDLQLKSAMSVGLMALLVVAISQLAARTSVCSLTSELKLIVVVVGGVLALDFGLGLSATGGDIVRTGGIYPEPSHLALAVAPVLVGLMCARRASDRLWGWASFVVLTMLSASTTLFAIVTLCLVTALLARSRRSLSPWLLLRIVAGIGFVVGLIAMSPYAPELVDRVTGLSTADESANLSSLVYLNGWETAWANLQATQGFGLGFNRMGCEPRADTATGALLDGLQVGDLNYNDGSFTMSKLLSELGLFGLAFWACSLALLLRLTFAGSAKRTLAVLPPEVHAMLIGAITVFTLGALIRGTNYLSGPFLFGLFAMCMLMAYESRMRRMRRKVSAAPHPAPALPPPTEPSLDGTPNV